MEMDKTSLYERTFQNKRIVYKKIDMYTISKIYTIDIKL